MSTSGPKSLNCQLNKPVCLSSGHLSTATVFLHGCCIKCIAVSICWHPNKITTPQQHSRLNAINRTRTEWESASWTLLNSLITQRSGVPLLLTCFYTDPVSYLIRPSRTSFFPGTAEKTKKLEISEMLFFFFFKWLDYLYWQDRCRIFLLNSYKRSYFFHMHIK